MSIPTLLPFATFSDTLESSSVEERLPLLKRRHAVENARLEVQRFTAILHAMRSRRASGDEALSEESTLRRALRAPRHGDRRSRGGNTQAAEEF